VGDFDPATGGGFSSGHRGYTISSFIEMTRKRVEIGIRVIDVDGFLREFV